jgi:hypothetical protein
MPSAKGLPKRSTHSARHSGEWLPTIEALVDATDRADPERLCPGLPRDIVEACGLSIHPAREAIRRCRDDRIPTTLPEARNPPQTTAFPRHGRPDRFDALYRLEMVNGQRRGDVCG